VHLAGERASCAANRDIPRADDGSLPACWLLAEWPPHADEPTDYWLSTLPPDTPIAEIVRLAKIRWRIEVWVAPDNPRWSSEPI